LLQLGRHSTLQWSAALGLNFSLQPPVFHLPQFILSKSAMPIYAYKCASCGHSMDKLQKMSDDPLTVCPVCGQAALAKQVTAAGFQLKGSGWYATDFKNGGAKSATATQAKPEGRSDEASNAKAESKSESKLDATPATKTEAPAAASPGSSSSVQ
jgi:putative FmdB family regulatory protein